MLIDDFYHKFDGQVPRPDGVLKIHNVAEYINTTNMNALPGAEDAICLRKPFPVTWFDFAIPSDKYTIHIAALSEEGPIENELYGCSTLYLVKRGQDPFRVLGETTIVYTEQGKYVQDKRNRVMPYSNDDRQLAETTLHEMCDFVDDCDRVVILALNFLHCRNVEIVENPLRAIEIKARKAGNRDYFEKYYTLRIDPIKRILNTEGQAETRGLKYALHICRGHFKTYEGKGLFGKYPGTYFWPAHVRGDGTVGKIHKDYSIEPRGEK